MKNDLIVTGWLIDGILNELMQLIKTIPPTPKSLTKSSTQSKPWYFSDHKIQRCPGIYTCDFWHIF